MSDKHYIGLDVTDFEDNKQFPPISRVTLLADDENAFTAGDDTGMEITADCPHATQAMAEAILAKVQGYRYQMYSADAANIDPAAELGDAVTVGGIYSVLSRVDDDGSGYPSISAPGEIEPEDEYPSGGPVTQAFNRKLAATRSQITKTAEEIRLSIESVESELEDTIISSLEVAVDGIRSEVASRYVTQSEHQTDIQSLSTQIEQTGDSITFQFNRISEQISELEGENQRQVSEFQKYIRFEDGNIIQGAVGSPFRKVQSATRESYYVNDVEVSYWSNQAFYVNDVVILNSLRVNKFAFIPRENGHVSFKKVVG